MSEATTREEIAERFHGHTVPAPPSECVLWCGHVSGDGYGQFTIRGRKYGAHRVSYELSNGPIPDGRCVMHKCDVPTCVNPRHLSLGTHADNSHDCVAKKRHSESRKTACEKGHPFDERNTHNRRTGGRRCRTCNAANVAAYKGRRRGRG